MKEYFVDMVNGESMKPFYNNGDFFAFRDIKKEEEIKRKEIILFWNPTKTGGKMLKRVIGLPKEKVEYKDGFITIEQDGQKTILEESYIKDKPLGNFYWELGTNEFLVLGDNRGGSQDSRVFGPIKKDKIIAKIIGRMYRFGERQSSYKLLTWD